MARVSFWCSVARLEIQMPSFRFLRGPWDLLNLGELRLADAEVAIFGDVFDRAKSTKDVLSFVLSGSGE